MLIENDITKTAHAEVCMKATDRDKVALHTGRILQSCSMVENAIFRMISARGDIEQFSSIQRSKRPAFRNVMRDVREAIEASISKKLVLFKNPKRFLMALAEFDRIASLRSDLAHAEYVTSGEIEGEKIVILSNEGIEGTAFKDRKVQIVTIDEIISMDRAAHRLAHTLHQIIVNQVSFKPMA